jgi:hypothetical protein
MLVHVETQLADDAADDAELRLGQAERGRRGVDANFQAGLAR